MSAPQDKQIEKFGRYLGKSIETPDIYDRTLLTPIRRKSEDSERLDKAIKYACDNWDCYELSFLDPKPFTFSARIQYSGLSEFLVESKSLKLYLQSLNNSEHTKSSYLHTIKTDLQEVLNTEIQFNETVTSFTPLEDTSCYNTLIECYYTLSEIETNKGYFSYPHFRSICPVTGQPDWAEIVVYYEGEECLNRTLFTEYLIGFRNHGDFHETCADAIFSHLYKIIQPKVLTVAAFFSRRGGISISPVRSTCDNIIYKRFCNSRSSKLQQ